MLPLSLRITAAAKAIAEDRVTGEEYQDIKSIITELEKTFVYELALMEQFGIAEPSNAIGYVLCTKGRGGHFNKWAKFSAGIRPTRARRATTWSTRT